MTETGHDPTSGPDEALIERRQSALAPSYQLFYDDPVELVAGDGMWVRDANGRRYLDCYNNVASVGHAHPRVVEAIAKQSALINTHTRYLHPFVVELAERLGTMLPGDLATSWFVCTGTEANDLAVRIARAATGHHGVIVTEHSYHGNSELVSQLSTDSYPASARPDWLAVVEPPNTFRGSYRTDDPDAAKHYAADVARACETLQQSGHGVAALLIDTSWDSNGVLVAPDGYVGQIAQTVRNAGGVVIADEVQAGYCRLGQHFWGHLNYGLVPDIVTIGKPMGAGHPVAAVVSTPDIAARFAERHNYFNTFGGNPVSAAVALAVLDVIEDEGLMDNAAQTGVSLGAALRELQARHPIIGNVQGSGLFWGLDLVADDQRTPLAYADAKRIVSELSRRGVLVGVTGPNTNVLKIRPPLVFGSEHQDVLIRTLDDFLTEFRPLGGDDRRRRGAEW